MSKHVTELNLNEGYENSTNSYDASPDWKAVAGDLKAVAGDLNHKCNALGGIKTALLPVVLPACAAFGHGHTAASLAHVIEDHNPPVIIGSRKIHSKSSNSSAIPGANPPEKPSLATLLETRKIRVPDDSVPSF